MATLFSLNDGSFLLLFPSGGPLLLERRVAALATLDGAETRDLGAREGGLRLQLQTTLDDVALHALNAAVADGTALGLSCGAAARAVMAERLQAGKLAGGGNAVTLQLVVARRL